MLPTGSIASFATTVIAVSFAVAGCASDAFRSSQATGFNAYLKELGRNCQPLVIGNQDVGHKIVANEMGDDNNYHYFLSVTADLYYNRLTPPSYRQALVGFFGAGTPNERSFECIFRNLPADRPNAPVGVY